MNLNELCGIQGKLDKRIVEEHGLQGQDLLDKKILSLQVELGELANEWRGFKFWSRDQNPRNEVLIECEKCGGSGRDYYDYCGNCQGGYVGKENPLLEEYVDCLHFILSIGLDIEVASRGFYVHAIKQEDVISTFNQLFNKVSDFYCIKTSGNYKWVFSLLVGLGEQLGFTEQQIYDAYMDKNKTNHSRQDNDY